MKILFATDYRFFPVRNGSQRVYAAWLRALVARGHDVSVLSFNHLRERWDPAGIAELASCARRHLVVDLHAGPRLGLAKRVAETGWNLVADRYLPVEAIGRRWRGAGADRLAEFVRGEAYDAVIVHKIFTAHYIGLDLLAQASGCKILDMHDSFPRRMALIRRATSRMLGHDPGLFRLALDLDHLRPMLRNVHEDRLLAETVRTLRAFDLVTFYIADELAAFCAAGLPRERAEHVAMPYDLDAPPHVEPLRRFDIGFIGSAALFNLEALAMLGRGVVPLLRARGWRGRVLVAGGVARFAGRFMAAEDYVAWPQFARIESFYEAVAVVAVPIVSGTGVSVKAIEAAVMGAAIVTTSPGVRGAALVPGRDCVVADTADGFAAAIASLLADPPRRAALGAAAAQAARAHGVDRFGVRLEALLGHAIERAPLARSA
jgi:glycosyltransferase involved in cell wall biosynthesis